MSTENPRVGGSIPPLAIRGSCLRKWFPDRSFSSLRHDLALSAFIARRHPIVSEMRSQRELLLLSGAVALPDVAESSPYHNERYGW